MLKELPFDRDLEKYAPSYTPETFTPEEQRFLKPFFSNIDKQIYTVTGLPQELVAALLSRYSRATLSIRRVFLKEYVEAIVHPENQKEWVNKSESERLDDTKLKDKFLDYIDDFEKKGGVAGVVNSRRAREFFKKWLSDYGDDSIAEMGGIHLCIEGISNLVLEDFVDKRMGISLIVKSSRYVNFGDLQPDGHYAYVVPAEIIGTPLEEEYRQQMDLLYSTYARLAPEYLNYIKAEFPQGEDEKEDSFKRSRGAKRWDDLRELLPFSSMTSAGFFGDYRAFEELVNRLLDHPLGEARYWAKEIIKEISQLSPSLIERPKTERGAKVQRYKSTLRSLSRNMSDQIQLTEKPRTNNQEWVKLVRSTPDADIEVLSGIMFAYSSGKSYHQIREFVTHLDSKSRAKYLQEVIDARGSDEINGKRESIRFKKVPKAFEFASYLFEMWCRGGDFRDLHRHRMATILRGLFTIDHGFDLEKEVLDSRFADEIKTVLLGVQPLFTKMKDISPDLAQYAVPFAYIQHWVMQLSARSLYWIGELRTGPQARSHYKQVVLQMIDQAQEKDPAILNGIMVDRNDYRLARRESEKKRDKNQ